MNISEEEEEETLLWVTQIPDMLYAKVIYVLLSELTLLSSFFIVTRSRDFSECPVGAIKYKQAWMRVSW